MDTAVPGDSRLSDALDYWRAKAGERRMPRRCDIDPADIPRLLRNIMLVELLDGRFRYRLVGTEIVRCFGFDATGKYLDDVLVGPEYRDHVLSLYEEVVEARRPLYSECVFLSPDQRLPQRHIKVIFLPVSEDGDSVRLVLVVQIFSYVNQETRDRHLIDAQPYKELVHVLL